MITVGDATYEEGSDIDASGYDGKGITTLIAKAKVRSLRGSE